MRRSWIRAVAIVGILLMVASVVAVAIVGREGPGEPAEPTDEPTAATTAAAAPCDDVDAPPAPEVTATPYDAPPEMQIDPDRDYVAALRTTCGEITLELLASEAPRTVNNFVALAGDGYYDGVGFHRVIEGFMIQGGDPTGTGHGGQGRFPGYTFEDELSLAQQVAGDNGGYPRGTVAMANAGPDTNGSQFFIMHGDYALPPDYSVFGHVLEGMEVVDRIVAGPNGDQVADPVRIVSVDVDERPGDAGDTAPAETPS